MTAADTRPLRIGTTDVPPGKKVVVELPVARLFTGAPVSLGVVAIHGKKPGPRVWLDAAIHGDELNGMRIIRQVVQRLDPAKLRGSILAVPVVNAFGLIQRTRYLPDRRDLNRSFPGSSRGSLASRLAHLFLQEVVAGCDAGIDLHTGGPGRTNLPHIRTDFDHPMCRRLAEAFGAPLSIGSNTLPGSLRHVCVERGVPLLVYEAGEPQRFNRFAIKIGTAGVLRVLQDLDMWEADSPDEAPPNAGPLVVGKRSVWLRAGRSGVFNTDVRLGSAVTQGETLGTVANPFQTRGQIVRATIDGLVMGMAVDPLVHQGDALLHLVEIDGGAPDDAVELFPPQLHANT